MKVSKVGLKGIQKEAHADEKHWHELMNKQEIDYIAGMADTLVDSVVRDDVGCYLDSLRAIIASSQSLLNRVEMALNL